MTTESLRKHEFECGDPNAPEPGCPCWCHFQRGPDGTAVERDYAPTDDYVGAQEAYARRAAEVRELIEHLSRGLDAHAASQAGEPRNWEFVGDLTATADRLRAAARTLNREE